MGRAKKVLIRTKEKKRKRKRKRKRKNRIQVKNLNQAHIHPIPVSRIVSSFCRQSHLRPSVVMCLSLGVADDLAF
ncbi:hypothetical protein V6N13_059249 [Hibiscus sabdariffa]